jgi:hypothetical protein
MRFSRRSLIRSAAVSAPALILPRAAAEMRGEPPNIDQAYLTPFSVNSPWNIRPVSPVLGTTAIGAGGPKNFAQVIPTFNDQVFYATASDPSDTVNAYIGDELNRRVVTIPHWPAAAVPATGSDHHMDIYDSPTRTLHSFWDLEGGPGTWACGMYMTYSIDGTGWGSPSRPGGPRASGVSAAAGLLRTWEQDLPMVNHALCFGVDLLSVLDDPIFPATQQDINDYGYFKGPFHYGTRFMLPSTFDLNTLGTSQAKAIARTLMTYGGFLTDTTSGPPGGNGGFNYYAEIGSTWPNASNYNGSVNVDLETIRSGLRAVTSVSGWQDRSGNSVSPTPWNKMQLLSMRGPWLVPGGSVPGPNTGFFNTVSNFYEFPDTTVTPGVGFFIQTSRYYRDDTSAQPWSNWVNFNQWYLSPTEGTSYTLSVVGFGNQVSARLKVFTGDRSGATQLYDSGNMFPGDAPRVFTWPAGGAFTQAFVAKGAGPAGSIRLELIAT